MCHGGGCEGLLGNCGQLRIRRMNINEEVINAQIALKMVENEFDPVSYERNIFIIWTSLNIGITTLSDSTRYKRLGQPNINGLKRYDSYFIHHKSQ